MLYVDVHVVYLSATQGQCLNQWAGCNFSDFYSRCCSSDVLLGYYTVLCRIVSLFWLVAGICRLHLQDYWIWFRRMPKWLGGEKLSIIREGYKDFGQSIALTVQKPLQPTYIFNLSPPPSHFGNHLNQIRPALRQRKHILPKFQNKRILLHDVIMQMTIIWNQQVLFKIPYGRLSI